MIDWDLIDKDVVAIAKCTKPCASIRRIVTFIIEDDWLYSSDCGVEYSIEKCEIIAIRPSAMITVANAINKKLHDVDYELKK